MKQKIKRQRVSAIPLPPTWARREILKLARDSGMVTERLYDIVLKNGLEATRTLLEEQITFIASIDNGPITETNEVETPATADKVKESDQPVQVVNGTQQPKTNGIGTRLDHVSERRDQPGESKPDDFLTGLVSESSGGEVNTG